MFKTFGRLLLMGWALFILMEVGGFLLPKFVSPLVRWIDGYIVLIPISLVLATALFLSMLVFRNGMKRSSF